MICSFDYLKKLQFEVLQNAVREKPAKLEELTLLKVRLWLVVEYFMNGNFREFSRGKFPLFRREFPVALAKKWNYCIRTNKHKNYYL